MSSATPAQRLPAWKRLGLKLRPEFQVETGSGQGGARPAQILASAAAPQTPRSPLSLPDGSSVGVGKRKSSGFSAIDQSSKRIKRDCHASSASTQPLKSAAAPDSKPARNQPKHKASAQAPGSKHALNPRANVNLQRALEYLHQWHTARDEWRFKKNLQTKLLESVFSEGTTIPANDINKFYEYIKALKGDIRRRLRQSAMDAKKKDVDLGAAGFRASKEVAEKKQQEYDALIASYLKQSQTPGKRPFEEVGYVLRTADLDMQRRVVKRMRAETVLEELSENEDTATSITTACTGVIEDGTAGESTGRKDARGTIATPQPKKKRKTRTAMIEDDSSSSESSSPSESESDAAPAPGSGVRQALTSASSSSDSSDSSSEESDEEVEAADQTVNDEDESCSSSLSSSSSSSEEDDD